MTSSTSKRSSSRVLSLFDSLGPIMTGPSSSHTAGMARIGRMAALLLGGRPESITLSFFGALAQTYKGHASDSALVAGLLGETEYSSLIRDALTGARDQNIPVRCMVYPESERNPNLVRLELIRQGRKHCIEGISRGGGECELVNIDGMPVSLRGYEDGVIVLAESPQDTAAWNACTGSEAVWDVEHENGLWLYSCLNSQKASSESLEKLRLLPGVQAVFPVQSILPYKLHNAKPLFTSFTELVQVARQYGSLPQAIEAYEIRRSGVSREWIQERVLLSWRIMQQSIQKGLSGANDMLAGLVCGDNGKKLEDYRQKGNTLSGGILNSALGKALAVMESNASMRCVVASPTAGACGILPGALAALAEHRTLKEADIYRSLLVAAATGVLIASRAPISGALGGCQSEIGVASAMAAAAMTQLGGGTAEQVLQAVAMALKNMLGLICDPVGGPVEVPCIKRNAVGVANAFAAADMALAGIESRIPADEVVSALINVQGLLPPDLRGNLKGGLASTPTGLILKETWRQRLRNMQKKEG